MMTNLFSIFDPSTHIFSLSLNWLAITSPLILMSPFWIYPPRLLNMMMLIFHGLKTEFNVLLGITHFPGAALLMISLFFLILMNNSLGLFPYIFTPSSHPTMTISLALPMWMGLMAFGWLNHTTHMLAHLVPTGTPTMLMSFMVIIESISNLIRPLTLAVRLAANMIAGHLLLTLLGNQGPSLTNTMLPILLFTQLLLMILEIAVAVIQAYVFTVLMTLYISESTYVKS